MSHMIAIVVAALALSLANALWPIPTNMTTGEEVLFIDQGIKVTYNGKDLQSNSDFNPPEGPEFDSQTIVQSGVSRAFKGIFDDNFVPWKLRPRNSDFEPAAEAEKKTVKSLKIEQAGEDQDQVFKPTAGSVDESYSLEITQDGDATIKCQASTGCLFGLESFVQLFYKHSDESQSLSYTPYAPVSIQDAPKFPHRGLVMDLARNWYPVEDIKRTIDAMSWNKMNRLHLHMTNSQSWPIQIPALPELADKGAYRKGMSYSPKDISGIYEYATYRGVAVIMEIDMPNHIGIVELAYPEKDLTVAFNKQPWQWYCLEPPCGAFQMDNANVTEFVDELFEDLLPRVSPYAAYFHTGGDELYLNDSAIDPTVNSNETAVIVPLLQKFIDHVHGKVRDAGLTPVVWEDLISDYNQTLGDDVVVQAWLNDDSVKKLAEAGHKVIDSNHNFYYLDCGRGQWLNFDNGVEFQKFYPFPDYCSPTKNWRLIYSHDPTAGLSEEAAKRVLGGEVAAWSEMTDGVNLDTNVWPRASAAGEVLWSGRQDASGQNRSQLDAAPRLAELRERMVARGVRALPVQMIYCTQGNRTDCANSV
ncbi:hypothetical protein XA68_13658 [Ophiocordyceps unilateralis]|uniref:Beta-hexosaminidase n=1 Tax=Ophiocordyceps unilateralis TaxID=268505 RepID=A0A2A9PNI4_OPHUN|nr:hypothetical protein XA68_13658 [Ophiocordyceps unilateralis]